MKIISWNINGFRSLLSRSLLEAFSTLDADVYCLQETKLQSGQGGVDLPGFHQFWSYADRPGYSGTAVLTLKEPIAAYSGIGHEVFDAEGRLITLDFGSFYLVNCYAPNTSPDLTRLEERVQWDAALLAFVQALDQEKPVVLCGDMNAAYNASDLDGKDQGMHIPGFTREEREGLTSILNAGFIDAYRHFHPDGKTGDFAYRRGIRAMGMDYFLVSERFVPMLADCRVHSRVRGSDHWPLELVITE